MWTADPPTVCTTLLRLVSRCRAMVRGGLRRSRRTRARSLARASTLGIILSVTSLKWAKSNLIHKTHLNLDFDACGENKESTSRKAYFIHAHTSGDLEWSKEMNYYFFSYIYPMFVAFLLILKLRESTTLVSILLYPRISPKPPPSPRYNANLNIFSETIHVQTQYTVYETQFSFHHECQYIYFQEHYFRLQRCNIDHFISR